MKSGARGWSVPLSHPGAQPPLPPGPRGHAASSPHTQVQRWHALLPCPKLQLQAPPDAGAVWDGYTHHTSLCPLRSKRVHSSESAYATTCGASRGRALQDSPPGEPGAAFWFVQTKTRAYSEHLWVQTVNNLTKRKIPTDARAPELPGSD